MSSIIIDTGPLVAFLNRRDAFHAWSVKILDSIEPPLITCEAVLSEACFLVRNLPKGPQSVLDMVFRGLVAPSFRLDSEIHAVRALINKFSDVPMSLADACLVRLTEMDRKASILTLDSDFRVYRRNGRQVVPVIMPR